MSKISAKQRYETFTEWLAWFNKEHGRTKKTTKTGITTDTTDKSHKVDVKGFRKRKR